MMSHRHKNAVKNTLKSIGTGLDVGLTAIHNSPIRVRLNEIEEEMERLSEEKAELEAKLIHRT